MGADFFRKYATSSIIICYRSVLRHPVLVGMILFLFSMHRLFPLLFSALVSAAPVIVSTAVLLGTLLSFGDPNIPEIEKGPESQIQKLETRAEIVVGEGVNGSGIEVEERSIEGLGQISDVNLVGDGLLQFGEGKSEADEEKVVLGSHYSPLQQSEDEHIVLESDKLWEGSADPLNSNSGLLWKVNGGGGDDEDEDEDEDDDDDDDDEEEEEEEEDDDDGSESGDSGSDLAESSSPDASMADIIPMLDELHPLLSEDQETHQPSHVSRDAVSEHSLESGDTSSESNDDEHIENHESLKIGDDEDEDEESEQHIDKEDDTAITWTEDDQKNLMNLGTSELERNRRLENLIARRRARKTMRMQAEKNLIDLESADLPWNIPPISTSRNNPFDYDANDNIPGSAPSVMLQRRNPFDLPYDSSEEKPDLVGDTFQQEFATFQPKEPFFRRHESFNVGPSIFGASRSERQETKLKPYFVPERSFSSFQRQFSGLSDSKASSVPDTESVTSDIENKDHIEEEEHASEVDEHVSDHVSHARPYFVPEHVASDETSFASFQRQLSEVSESKVSSEPDTESVSSASSVGDIENKDHIDLSLEPDLISLEDPRGPDEAEISVESVANQKEPDSSGSSLSSSDEASEQIYNEKESDEVVSETDYFLDRGSSIERSVSVTSLLVEASQPNEPVYDLSPRSVTRNLSSSSISMDLHKDESFQHTDDHNQSSTSAQNQVPAVPDNEEHLLAVDSISTSLPNEPVLGASYELEGVQVSPSNSHARSNDKPLAEDLEELQAHDIEHGEVALPSYEAQFAEVVHVEPYENHGEDISQPQEEIPLLDTSEDNPEVLQVQINTLDNLQIQEPDVIEVAEIETKAQEIPAFASDTHSTDSNVDDGDEIKEIDEDLLMELDAVGDFSVKDFGSTLNEMEEGPHTSEHDLENKGIVEEDSYKNDLESNLSEMMQHPHVSEHDLETSHSVDEVSYSRDLGSTFDEIKQEYDIEDSDSVKDLGTTLDERKQDPSVLDHDLEAMISEDVDSDSKGLGSTLDEIKQDSHASDHALETKHSEEMDQDPHASDHDLETMHSGKMKQNPHVSDLDLETKPSEEIKQDPHALDHVLETKHFDFEDDDDSYSKEATLDEMEQNPHESSHDLETKHSGDDSYLKEATLGEMKQNLHDSSHDLEIKHSGDEDSYSKDATLGEMKQDPHALDHDLETKCSEDEDSYSKDATLEEIKQDPHESSQDLETKYSGDEDLYSKDATLEEMKQDLHALDHDLETKHSEDVDFYSKDATLDEMKLDPPQDSSQDLETKHSGDEDSYSKSKDLGSTLDEMKQDSHASDHDLETNQFINEDSYSKDLDTTFNETKQVSHALEHRLETFYSVDVNFYSKHVESTINEMKQGLPASDQDLETNRSGETKVTKDEEATQPQNENDISNTEVEGTFQAEASGSKLASDPQETESTTSLANSTSATTVNHGTENASTTSNTDKE